MKFAVQKWVRIKEMKVTHIHREGVLHPEYMQNYCAGCHAPLAGKPFASVWAEKPSGQGGGYKLCASCTEEAKAELRGNAILQQPVQYQVEADGDALWA